MDKVGYPLPPPTLTYEIAQYDSINIMKKTFNFDFDLYQAMDTQKHGNKVKL